MAKQESRKYSDVQRGRCFREVVVCTALDQIFSEPILQAFERQTGIRVKAVYDIEATKTMGLVNRLIAEKKNPQRDVFWNNAALFAYLEEDMAKLTSCRLLSSGTLGSWGRA